MHLMQCGRVREATTTGAQPPASTAPPLRRRLTNAYTGQQDGRQGQRKRKVREWQVRVRGVWLQQVQQNLHQRAGRDARL